MVKQKIDAFVDVELEEIRKRLDSGFPQSSEDEEEKKQAGKALMVIITYLLRSSDQDELAVWITGLERMNETDGFSWTRISPGSDDCRRVFVH